jgi:hypothetical protein
MGRIHAQGLAVSLLIALAGCGGGDLPPSPIPQPNPNPPAPSPTGNPCVAAMSQDEAAPARRDDDRPLGR